MRAKRVIYDIETMGLPHDELAPYLPERSEFDPDNVKLGAMKDPEKIAAKIEVEREKQVKAEDKAIQTAIDKAALSPETGQILCIGWHDDGLTTIMGGDPKAEKLMLELFWRSVVEFRGAGYEFWGWNSAGFDLPFIVKRSWRQGIAIPGFALKDYVNRRNPSALKDAMLLFTGFEYQTYMGLDRAAKYLGFEGKAEEKVTGKDFAAFYLDPKTRPEAVAYLHADLDQTAKIVSAITLEPGQDA